MWSESLQEQTREFFKNIPVGAMKQIGGKFGVCIFKDGIYHIIDRSTKEEYTYETMDLLIEDKWAID